VLDNLGDLKFEIEQLAEENSGDAEYNRELRPDSPNSVSDYLKFLIDQDRKSTPLKAIQGLIWQAGYEAGEIISPIFDDVPPALKRWKAADKTIAIYSSGSILAQQLLFRYTEHGDLTPFITNFFDTNIGPKREAKSYEDIAAALEIEPGEILFLSDVPAEVDAARSAGLDGALALRNGNSPVSYYLDLKTFTSFDEID
ncbi:MAG: acireductone synthase, partial [Acidobacteria bacterium]|nr:acireductone synthase [Acidobacteriota bacterium]